MDKHLLHTFVMCSMFFASCGSNDVSPGTWVTTPADSSKPVEFTDFTPKEGGVRTRMYITGSNFGTDETKIHVTIGGQKASVIGSDGKKIFCILPPRAYDGDIKVVINSQEGKAIADYEFEQRFTYVPKKAVGTLLRNYDAQSGSAPFQDGLFSDGAGIPASDWMMMDPKPANGDKIIFTSNFEGGSEGLRMINLTTQEVKTLSTSSRGNKQQSFAFSADSDTLLMTDDNGNGSLGNVTMANMFYALRSENFAKLRPYNYQACAYSLVYMPDGSIFYTVYPSGSILKMARNGGIPNIDTHAIHCFDFKQIADIENGQQIKLKAHPDGKYVYVFGAYNGSIMKSNYNPVTKLLETPTLVAGQFSGYNDESALTEGAGGLAHFGTVYSGTFVKNERYVTEQRDDVYDFYFADKAGHCIWKVDPDGISTIVAGRSAYTVDNKYYGYVDGDPLHEARFYNPRSITYDEDTETFYIGDYENKCIRYLRTE